jgi:hypothetical protein
MQDTQKCDMCREPLDEEIPWHPTVIETNAEYAKPSLTTLPRPRVFGHVLKVEVVCSIQEAKALLGDNLTPHVYSLLLSSFATGSAIPVEIVPIIGPIPEYAG